MDEQSDVSDRIIRFGAHFLGSLGLALLSGALLTALAPVLVAVFPWEVEYGDRLASALCGASLIGAACFMLLTAGGSWTPSDDELG
jgi:hypothetical protein